MMQGIMLQFSIERLILRRIETDAISFFNLRQCTQRRLTAMQPAAACPLPRFRAEASQSRQPTTGNLPRQKER